MSTDTHARQPAGTPVGGQFAATTRPEADVVIDTPAGARARAAEDLDRANAQMRQAREVAANATTHLIAAALLDAEPKAGYLELYDMETEYGFRVYASRVLDADGQTLHEGLEDFLQGDAASEAVYDEVTELVGCYESTEHAGWCDAVSDPGTRADGKLSASGLHLIDLHAAKALYPSHEGAPS